MNRLLVLLVAVLLGLACASAVQARPRLLSRLLHRSSAPMAPAASLVAAPVPDTKSEAKPAAKHSLPAPPPLAAP